MWPFLGAGGGKVFANVVIKDLEMRSFWIIQVGPKSNEKRPYKTQKRRKHGQRGEGHVTMKAEAGLCSLSRGAPGATRSWRRQGRILPRTCGGAQP